MTLGFGSAWHAFRPAVGAYLLINWFKQCDAALIFGASNDALAVFKRTQLTFYTGVNCYFLNKRYTVKDDTRLLRRLAKQVLNRVKPRHRLLELGHGLPSGLKDVSVQEQTEFDDGLLAFESGFPFRFAPAVEYLAWRYSLQAPHLRFRLFRIVHADRYVGYVILQEDRLRVTVAQADGTEPVLLAAGILQSIAASARMRSDHREVLLASSHPDMQRIFESAGFRNRPRWNRPFAIGKLKGGIQIRVPVTQWLVNFGWGDNGQRPPWRDQEAARFHNG
jgi:hypothetical protein